MPLESPGVYTREFDESYLEAIPAEIGPILVGETETGPAFSPIVVENFSEYRKTFGDYENASYMPYAAASILRNTDQLTVIRVLGTTGYTSKGTLFIQSGAGESVVEPAKIFAVIKATQSGSAGDHWNAFITGGEYYATGANEFALYVSSALGEKVYESLSLNRTSTNYIGKIIGFSALGTGAVYVDKIYNYAITADVISSSELTNVSSAIAEAYGTASTGFNVFSESYCEAETPTILSQKYAGDAQYRLFKIHTISDGNASNRFVKFEIRNVRPSSNSTNDYGTFTVAVRDFYDTNKHPIVLETFNNLSFDPESPNYIVRRIGDKYPSWDTTNLTLTYAGDFDNISKYIRIAMYDLAGAPDDTLPFGFAAYQVLSGSIPAAAFASGFEISNQYSIKAVPGIDLDNIYGEEYLFDKLPLNVGTTTSQSAFYLGDCSASISGGATYTGTVGLTSTTPLAYRKFLLCPAGGFDGYDPAKTPYNYSTSGRLPCTTIAGAGYLGYKRALDILSNEELTEGDLIGLPGLNYNDHSVAFIKAEDMIEERGNDLVLIVDPYDKGETNCDTVTAVVDDVDNSYLAAYWPWIKVLNPDNNTYVWKPASCEVIGAMKMSDRVSHPWFAPAGLNRATLTRVKEAEMRLTEGQRDTLYVGRVNPLATFIGEGVVVWGQKNLQLADSLLNRINVRRLVITAKRLIKAIARYLVFEPNDSKTRGRFTSLINPILDNIRQNRGLKEFKVICDETNNTPDLIDRNTLRGQIYLKPTTSAEFLLLDFFVTKMGIDFAG